MIHKACGLLIHGQGRSILGTLVVLNCQYDSLDLLGKGTIGRVQHGGGSLVMTVRAGKPVKYLVHDSVLLSR